MVFVLPVGTSGKGGVYKEILFICSIYMVLKNFWITYAPVTCLGWVFYVIEGAFKFVSQTIMEEPSSSKRCHVVTGSTPHKPFEKRSREGSSHARKPLDFSVINIASVDSSTSPSYKVLFLLLHQLCVPSCLFAVQYLYVNLM